MTVGLALCGSFCTYAQVFPVMEQLAKEYDLVPIFSAASVGTDSRFGKSADFMQQAEHICQRPPLTDIPQVEPIGPTKLLDLLLIAPCTGNTLAKLAHGIADGPVTMAAKSHLRNGRPVVVALSTNDGLSGAAENIGRLLNRKHYYFVPFRQDDWEKKPSSLVAEFGLIPDTVKAALQGRQIQPVLLPALSCLERVPPAGGGCGGEPL